MSSVVVIGNKLSDKYVLGGINTFINPYSYLLLRKQKKLISGFNSILVDGQFLILLFRLLGIGRIKRKSFDMTSLAPEIFMLATKQQLSICFLGSKLNEVTSAVQIIQEEYPNLDIVYHRDGYFLGGDREAELEKICSIHPDIVIAGLGTPLQEKFLLDLKIMGWEGTGFTCGGFLHQTASGIEYYPKWIDKMNLRWAYRIFDEPKLFYRYFFVYPKAISLIIWDFKIKPFFSR